MDRLKALVRFAAATIFVGLFLRAVHMTIPLVVERAPGIVGELRSISEVPAEAGFTPLLPFYRPRSLGPRPARIVIDRSGPPTVRIEWRESRWLEISERQEGGPPVRPPSARPIAGFTESWLVREGRTWHAGALVGSVWVELRTDLDDVDVERIFASLGRWKG